jgi:hypothetical protein
LTSFEVPLVNRHLIVDFIFIEIVSSLWVARKKVNFEIFHRVAQPLMTEASQKLADLLAKERGK